MNAYGVKAYIICVGGGKTVSSPCYRAISERFRDEFHDEAIYRLTFFSFKQRLHLK